MGFEVLFFDQNLLRKEKMMGFLGLFFDQNEVKMGHF